MKTLILASTSRYRADLLRRLRHPFTTLAPDCDETPEPGESPSELVQRLSVAKATSLAPAHTSGLIIGSDQVCDLADNILGKPGTASKAAEQLRTMSAQTVIFRTGLCLLDGETGETQVDEVETMVRFRTLKDDEIRRYVKLDKPLDCAGSFRSEGLGISLVETLEGPDPTALVGLPLIRLTEMLRTSGVSIP